MKIDPQDFKVSEGAKVSLKKWPTRVKPFYDSREDYEKILHKQILEMRKLQNLLYAHNRYALLLIFQAMDAAGKDGAIKHVMSGINPQGCQVFSFKQPSVQELEHDFLWRTTRCLPERGRIGIFNRSYYEEVIVTKVHPEILYSQPLPKNLLNSKTIWRERYESIRDFELHLHRNGTKVVKFFLHLSKEEQRKRFLDRIEKPEKNWKFSPADLKARGHWEHYRKAYETCLSATSVNHAPWYAIPADDKANARLIISKVILETLKKMKMEYPRLGKKHQRDLRKIRKQLER